MSENFFLDAMTGSEHLHNRGIRADRDDVVAQTSS